MSLPTHDEPWLHDELDGLLSGEPEMGATVLDDVRRGERARAAHRRRRTVALTVSALVVAVAVPLGVTLRNPEGGTTPSDRSDSALGHVWTPAEGYVAPEALAGRLTGLVPAASTVVRSEPFIPAGIGCPAASGSGCGSDGSAGWSVDLRVGDVTGGSALSVRESVEAIPDVGLEWCRTAPLRGSSCTTTRPWTKVGDAWVTGVRTSLAGSSCADTVVVRRGRTAVTVQEALPDTACSAAPPSSNGAPLSTDQLTALALATPLVQPLASFIDVSIYGPELTATPAPSSTVPVRALWSPSDGYVGQDQFVARARQAMPQDVTAELVGPSSVRAVPCNVSGICGGFGGYPGYADPNAPKPVTAAFNVSRGSDTGLLVLGEDTTSGNSTVALRTCLGYAGCTQLRPWSKTGEAWTAVFENVHAATGLVDRTAYVVRGASAFGVSAQTQVLRADDVLQTLPGANPVLTADELLAMAMTLPLGDYDGELIRHRPRLEHTSAPTSYDSVRACSADDLVLSLMGRRDDSITAGTDLAVPMEIRTGTRRNVTCVLSGIPSIRFSGGDSDRLRVLQGSGSAQVLVGPRAYAAAPVTRGSCTAGSSGDGPAAASLFAPDGGQAGNEDVAHEPYLKAALAPCASGVAASDTVTIGPFAVADSAEWPGPL